jgi:multiple sugar transport system substrate-binding protein
MKKSTIWAAGVVAVGALALTACGAGGGGGTAASNSPTSVQEVKFWGWAPGYADAVKAFNASHPNIKVVYEEVQPGAKGGYEKMLNAVKAHSAACLGQVGYETLTSFAAQGALEDVTQYAEKNKDEYVDWTWNAVSPGGKVYGAPVDTAPMALFYNKELFAKHGIAVPTTWDEYKAAAEKLKAADSNVSISSPYLNYDYAGLAWQAGAPWFGIDGDSWKVSLDSDANKKVADYWQSLVDAKVISTAPMYDPAWFKGLGDGTIATLVGPVWQAGVIKGDAKAGAGKWAVAPMPQWKAGENKVGNAGGSATAVLKGCKTPEAAWTFANWMSTDQDAYSALIEKAALYPAAKALLDLPSLSKPDEYFSGEKIYDVFKAASGNVDISWVWGPNMPQTTKDLDDGLSKAWAGNGTLADAFGAAQTKTLDALTSQGLNVK